MAASSVVKKNIAANILGNGLSALLSVVFVPFYLKYLGVEAYGLVGVYAILQSVFMLADMGFSGTFTRETARLSALEGGAQQMRDLCRTFEGIFALVGVLIALIIAASSRMIAEHWVNLEQLSVATVASTIVLIGSVIGLQFPYFIYQGGMRGLQKQALLNVLLVGFALLRGLGTILVLAHVEASILAFFLCQAAICIAQLLAGRLLMWRSLPPASNQPSFDLHLIRPLWRFAAGTAGITMSGILLTQADKLILTKMLPLQTFGYYTLAGVVASVPGMIAMPFNNAIYPRFTQLIAMQQLSQLAALYHRSCQLVAVIVLPVGLVLASFSKEIVFLWTGNSVTAQNTFVIASILLAGSTLMSLMLLPYSLQLAFGWTRLGLLLNIICAATLIPSLIWLVSMYGVLGAALVSVLLYAGQFIWMIHFMHRRILVSDKWKWYVDDVGKPLLAAVGLVAAGRVLMVDALARPALIVFLGGVLLLAVCAAAMSAPLVRCMILAHLFRNPGHA